MSDITDPTCPASAGEAAQEQAAPAAELSTPGASLENFSVAEPENALPRATLETLPETIAAACGRAGWTSLMPVQSLALPYLLEGRDIMVQSRTGSGKTGCYLLPLVPRLDPELHAVQALILVPTRELAVQVEHEARTLFEGTGIRPVAVYGGVGYKKQMDALRDGAQLVVGTPGRVLDHLLRRTLSLEDLDVLVFDEADRMLSIGFYPDMKEVQRYLPRRRIHTSMFSATYPPHVLKLAGEFLTEPSMLSLSQKEVHVAEVQHLFCQSRPMDKDRVLVRLLETENPASAIIFCNTKANVHYITATMPTSCRPTFPRPAARPCWTRSARAACNIWWPRTWPRAASTSRPCPTSSSMSPRKTTKATSTVPAARAVPGPPGRSSRWWTSCSAWNWNASPVITRSPCARSPRPRTRTWPWWPVRA